MDCHSTRPRPRRLRLTLLLGVAILLRAGVARAETEAWRGPPVVARNADGRLEVFRVGSDGQLRHRWQKTADGDWSAWSSLGGTFFPDVATGLNSQGELEAFAISRADHSLLHCRQTSASGTGWSAWSSLGGPFLPGVAVEQNAAGQVELFAVAAVGGAAQHSWEFNSNGTWSAWSSLGGKLAAGLAAARNRDGRLELFGISATNRSMVHCWQQQTNDATDWSGWAGLGGTVAPGFAATLSVSGRLELFAVNTTNHLVQRSCQDSSGSQSPWTPWEDFSGPQAAPAPSKRARPGMTAAALADDASAGRGSADSVHPAVSAVVPGLAVAQSVDGRLEVFAVDARGGTLLHRWELSADASDEWSRWASLGIPSQAYPAVVRDGDGDLEVFAPDYANPDVINHRRQISRASDWLDWSSLDQPTSPYLSRTWQTDEGLPNNDVQAITQTRDGYLWVGTPVGLARFDGLSFTVFDSRTTPELRVPSITALCRGHNGALWIGTDGGGLVRLLNGAFSHYGKAEGLAGDVVQALCEGSDGALWIGTTNGMSRFVNGQFANFSGQQGLLSPMVRSLYEDRDRNLWIATGAGLNRLSGGVMDAFPMPNNLPNDSVRCIYQDRGGRIWIGSNNGMLWYNWYWSKSFYAYNTKYGLSDIFVSAIGEDQERNLWVGTYSGLNRFHEGRFYPELNNEGVPFDRVNALFEDRQGTLWVGSRDGLTRLTPKHFFCYTRQQGLAHNNVMSVLQARDDTLWVATWGGGLNQLKGESVASYLTGGTNAATPTASTNRFTESLLLSLCEGRDGSLWVGADFDGGLIRLKDDRITRYTARDGLINAPITVLLEDRSGDLWIGTSRGLCRFHDGKFSTYTGRQHPGGGAVRAILEDDAGGIWFGTDGGLSRWQNGAFETLTTANGLSNDRVLALYSDAAQDLWVGTAEGGLNRVRFDSNHHLSRITSYAREQGLFSDEIFAILEDREGWLWMSCAKGIFRVRKRDLDAVDEGTTDTARCITYGKADGLETAPCNGAAQPAGWRGRDGRLWFPTTKGLIAVDPDSIKINNAPPPVYIEAVMADRRLIMSDLGRDARQQPRAFSGSTPVRLPPGRGELEFHYTALDLQDPADIRFKYRLENADADWIEAGARRSAHYYNLAPGNYRFHVMAGNRDGAWSDVGAVLAIILEPHFYQTWWWRSLLVLLLLGGASGSALYLTRRRMQRKLVLLEQRHAIERERGRIAKDIHDDLGSSLTRIMMLGERAEDGLGKSEAVGVHVGKIVATARRTLETLDEIVWAVNPENDTLEGLVEYLSHYADEVFENTNIRCRLEIPVRLPPFMIGAEVRHDLFLVVKEAFTNILKHSRATELRVQVSANAGSLQILIEDNGCGFDAAKPGPARRGHGLVNMRNRLESIGGSIAVISAPASGTRLQITARLPDRDGANTRS